MESEENIFNKGDAVEEPGEYICVPCGFQKYFNRGSVFTECTSCLSGTENGEEAFIEGTELWEKVQEDTDTQEEL